MPKRVVLAYSGGLDTSVAVRWMIDELGVEVIALAVDVGQAAEDYEVVKARARAAGAVDAIVVDAKEEYAAEYCAPALAANALYEGRYPLVSALSRPVIAETVAAVALDLDADAVVHGCTGKGNDQLRFEIALRAKYPGVRVIAPLRDRIWTREEEIAYALARGIPVAQTAASPYSIDANLLGCSIEAGVLEDPWTAPPEEAYVLTASPDEAPPPSEVSLAFDEGVPVALDGEELGLADLVAELNARAGAYGIGRIDMVENRAVGIKSREVYEAPAALVLIEAHRALEDLVLTRAELQEKRRLEDRWATHVYEGHWFSPLREAIDAFVDVTQQVVEGEVRVELRAAAATVTGRRSPQALYAHALASYGAGETFPHAAAEGFVQIAALEAELAASRERGRAAV
jgi:argininosuccinate synthase